MSYLTKDEFDKYVKQARESKYLTIDTEGRINHPFSDTWGVSTSAGGQGDYFAFSHRLGNNLPIEWLPELVQVIQNHPCLIMHHAKHDLRALRNLGVDPSKVQKFYCTMLMAHMNDENYFSKELDYLSRQFGGEPKRNSELQDQIIKAFGWDYIPVDVIRPYGANDAFITEDLFYKLYSDFVSQGFDGELWDFEQEFCKLLMDMEDTGILINQSFCEQELDRGLKIMAEIKKELGFNPGSPDQLGKFLLEDLKLPPVGKRGKRGKYSFNKENMKIYDELLERNGDHRAKLIMTYRGWSKTTGSNYNPYLEKLSHDGRFRTNFKQHGTKTGRLSASILHQIPKTSDKDWNGKLKRAFIPRDGYTLWDADFSQLEFRLKAAYAGEKGLIAVFNDESRDIFNEMSAELGMPRDPTKTFNYTISYGGRIDRVSHVFGVSNQAAKAMLDNYFNKYPGFLKFSRLAEARAAQQGFVRYWSGRRRHFQFPSEYWLADNSAIQGGAFEIVKRGSIRVRDAGLITKECLLNLQVHDDLVFEIENGKEDEYLPEIKKELEDVQPDFGVKFKVDINKWGTKEKWIPRAAA
jgi:DNA polymerase-1